MLQPPSVSLPRRLTRPARNRQPSRKRTERHKGSSMSGHRRGDWFGERSPALLFVHEAELRGLPQEVLQDLVALGVVGLLYVLVPRRAGAEHLEHHPALRVVLGLDQMHEDAARLLKAVPA